MLSHQARGQGSQAVLLLHGFLGSGRNLGGLVRTWSAQSPTLRFVQVDLPGHGRSPDLPPAADLHTMGEEVLETARALGLEAPYSVVGHSIGGRVALTMLDLAPEQITKMELLDIAPGPIPDRESADIADILLEAPERAPTREVFSEFLRGRGLSGGLTDWLLMNLDRDEGGFAWRIDRPTLVDFSARTAASDLWSIAEEHAAKLGCIRGGTSRYVGAEDVARYERSGIEVETIEGAGHFVHIDATEAVAARLRARIG